MSQRSFAPHQLIERYFDGLTTLAEEDQLRRWLAVSTDRSAPAEQARAVMGVFAASRAAEGVSASGPVRFRSLRVAMAAAAAVALLVVGSIWWWRASEQLDRDGALMAEVCSASVGGIRVDNRTEVEALMLDQIGEISLASSDMRQALDDDMASIADAINQL